ncbi:hypothetical protein BN1326_90011 [Staphylococcus argenteus]|uniref:Uncharacterized protein n=1 Tax=Staphylococcus argenteus TaxID=985002 RepID=A0A7U7PYS2_9STAP|nr:hypothetical protein BN1326_90011 [Staphylococcus argenteus]CRI29233.1 hypothetical protein BN1326_90011 [Staphylococcus argenteus]
MTRLKWLSKISNQDKGSTIENYKASRKPFKTFIFKNKNTLSISLR